MPDDAPLAARRVGGVPWAWAAWTGRALAAWAERWLRDIVDVVLEGEGGLDRALDVEAPAPAPGGAARSAQGCRRFAGLTAPPTAARRRRETRTRARADAPSDGEGHRRHRNALPSSSYLRAGGRHIEELALCGSPSSSSESGRHLDRRPLSTARVGAAWCPFLHRAIFRLPRQEGPAHIAQRVVSRWCPDVRYPKRSSDSARIGAAPRPTPAALGLYYSAMSFLLAANGRLRGSPLASPHAPTILECRVG